MRSAASPKRVGPLAPLRHRSFSFLFSGQLTSALGDQVFALALPWTVLVVTGEVGQVALVLAAEAIPRVLLLPVGGALADRINPRLVMLLSNVSRAIVVGALGVTLLSGLPPLWLVILFAALQGACSGLYLPGSQAILPWTVRNAEIPAANGLMQTILWLTMVVGPVLGGIAVAAQVAIAFLLDAASFMVSAITLAGIRLSTPDTPAAKASATIAERTNHEPVDTAEEPALTAKSLLALTTAPRLAIVRLEVEEAAPEDAGPERSPALETLADDETETRDEDALDGTAIEKAGRPPLDEPVERIASDGPDTPSGTAPPFEVKSGSQRERPPRPGVLTEIGAGLAYTFNEPLMRTTVVVSVLGNLAYAGTFSIALILLSRNLDRSPVTLGLLLGACGVGGVLGGLAAGMVGRRRRRGLLILLLWLIMSVALVLVPIYAGAAAQLPFPIDLSAVNFGEITLGNVHLGVLNPGDQLARLTAFQRLLAIAVLLGVTSCIIAIGETVLITVIQQRVPTELMARVFSVQFMAAGVVQPLSLIAVGFLSATYGAGVAFFAAAALFFIAAIVGLSSSALRRA